MFDPSGDCREDRTGILGSQGTVYMAITMRKLGEASKMITIPVRGIWIVDVECLSRMYGFISVA